MTHPDQAAKQQAAQTQKPFDDLLVVDVSGTVASAYTGKLFVDYGARVVNVEPVQGFSSRTLKPMLNNGHSAMHSYLNANKESISDSGSDSWQNHPAVTAADLLLLDPSTLGPLESLDDFDTNVCAISWFGLNGPYAHYLGSDAVIHALTGLMHGIGETEGPPILPQGQQAQIVGGLSAFNGALACLMGQQAQRRRNEAVLPFRLDASIYEANMCLTDPGPVIYYNDRVSPSRMGVNRFPPTYPLGIWPCKDGWLGVTCLSPAQWQAFCKLLGLDDLADVPEYQSSMARLDAVDLIEPQILERLAQHSAEDLLYRGQALRVPLARVPTMEELFTVDQYVHRQSFNRYSCAGESFAGPAVPFRLLETPPTLGGKAAELGAHNALWRPTAASNGRQSSLKDRKPQNSVPPPHSQPLKGMTIVDLAMGWAGPLAARNLADLGATVIKVEGRRHFDWWRSWEATAEWVDSNGAEKSPQYNFVNRNKLGVTLELDTPTGRELLLELIADADALIENYSADVLPKLKLDYEHLRQVNPQLVMVSMRAFGRSGPWSKFRAYGSTLEQSSGLPHLSGSENQPPTMLHVAFGDAIGGLNGSAAALSALYHKQRTGIGQLVDLSQAECLLPHAAPGILQQSATGEAPKRPGNDHPDFAHSGVYPCKGVERWIVIQASDEAQWQCVCSCVPGLKAFVSLTNSEQQAQRGNIEAALREWTRAQNAIEAMDTLQQAGVTAAVINSVADLLDDPHLRARSYLQMIKRDFVGLQPHPSSPWRLNEKPLAIRSPAPTLGQHNQEVLGGMLGLSRARLDALEEQGCIGTTPSLA